jgi:hypothetical protein
MAHTFNFAVLRLAPDSARGETINLGIVVFKDGAVDVRVGEILTRARVLFPEISGELLREHIELFRRLGSVDLPVAEKHRTLSSLGPFHLGELGSFASNDQTPSSYEDRVTALMQTFVRAPRRREGVSEHTTRFATTVRKEFRKEKVLAAIGDASAISEHKIVPEWPIPNHPSLKADLALRNGLMRVCELIDLDLTNDGPPPPSFFAGVVTLDVAKREANAAETVFAYRAKGRASEIDKVLSIAEPHTSKFVDWTKRADREAFLHEWINAARDGQPAASN